MCRAGTAGEKTQKKQTRKDGGPEGEGGRGHDGARGNSSEGPQNWAERERVGWKKRRYGF